MSSLMLWFSSNVVSGGGDEDVEVTTSSKWTGEGTWYTCSSMDIQTTRKVDSTKGNFFVDQRATH